MSVAVSLEPVELRDIALAIRDQTWLDIRHVEHGTINRVRVKRLQIAREVDEIVVEQNWCVGDGDFDQGTDEHTFDAEDIRWLRPTGVVLGEVVERLAAPVAAPDMWGAHAIIDQIVRQVAFTWSVEEVAIRAPLSKGRPSYEALRPRQVAMWLAYEMTNLSPQEICVTHFHYASQQPLVTVSEHVGYALRSVAIHSEAVIHGESAKQWLNGMRGQAKLLDTHFRARYRRTAPSSWRTFL